MLHAAVRRGFVFQTSRLVRLITLYAVYAAMPDMHFELRFLPTPPAFNAPIRGVPVRILPCCLVWEKLQWCVYPMVKKIRKYIRFSTIHERNGQTDRHTHRSYREVCRVKGGIGSGETLVP